jgi:hypothetical protein
MNKETETKYSAEPGETIYETARLVHLFADTWSKTHELVFNDRTLIIEPDTDPNETVRKYFDREE